jgi:hypothetical protein
MILLIQNDLLKLQSSGVERMPPEQTMVDLVDSYLVTLMLEYIAIVLQVKLDEGGNGGKAILG